MDNNIFSHFPDRETFDRYWNENYVPVTYEDVATVFRDFVKSAEGHIYLSDYEEKGCISKEDFKDNLSQEAQFAFQDGLTEVFYDKNPELYETAFALFAKNYQWEHPIRSVTVRAINLFEEDCPIQYDLFTDVKSLDRQERLDAAIEQIRFRFGKDAIKNGVLFQKSKMPTGMIG